METIHAEIEQEGERRDRRGRRLASPERWRELVAEYEGSGLTQGEFARRQGIKYPTFVAWLGRIRRGAGLAAPRFAEVRLAAAPPAALEVALPCGSVVRGSDPAAVAALVRALRG
jgi:transposase-like protein